MEHFAFVTSPCHVLAKPSDGFICAAIRRPPHSLVPSPRIPMQMRSSRKRPRGPAQSRRVSDEQNLASRVRELWETSSPGERAAFAGSAVVAGMAASWLLNAVIGVASFLAFGVFAFPFMMVAASASVAVLSIALAVFAAVSVVSLVGFSVIGLPLIVTGGILFKFIGPILIGVPLYLVSKALGRAKRKAEEEEERFLEDEFDTDSDRMDSFSEFDRKLHNRGGSPFSTPDSVSAGELALWSVQDCVSSLRSAGLFEASRVVAREQVDGQVLAMMDEEEVAEELAGELSVGERKKLVAWSRKFRL